MSISIARLECRIVKAVIMPILFLLGSVCSRGLNAQEPADDSEALSRVRNYRLVEITGDEKETELKLLPQSLLSWSNPVFGTTGGGLFLWLSDERPAVLMKTYKTKNNRWFEQVRSFSTNRVVARDSEQGEVFWSPEQGAEPMRPLPGALKSLPMAPTELSRMMQMKRLHQMFSVKGDIEGAGGEQELRAYPRPLYRYKNEDVIDGAMLGFVQGTGPDVVLILEAREVDGKAKWYYQVGSIGIYKVDVYFKDEVIWSEPRRTAPSTQPTDLYDGRRLPL